MWWCAVSLVSKKICGIDFISLSPLSVFNIFNISYNYLHSYIKAVHASSDSNVLKNIPEKWIQEFTTVVNNIHGSDSLTSIQPKFKQSKAGLFFSYYVGSDFLFKCHILKCIYLLLFLLLVYGVNLGRCLWSSCMREMAVDVKMIFNYKANFFPYKYIHLCILIEGGNLVFFFHWINK